VWFSLAVARAVRSRPQSARSRTIALTAVFAAAAAVLDGQPPGAAHGIDVDEGGSGTVAEPRMYQQIRQAKPIADRHVEIEFVDAGAEAFAFTFG
jgi:Thioredoxin like C-terminal domain